MEMLVLLGPLVAGVGMLSVIGWRERPRLPLQTVELRFGIDVTAAVVEAMLGSIAGLPRRTVVVVDALAEAEGIRHLLHADQQILDTLRGSWQGLLPSLRVHPAEAVSPIGWTGGVALRLGGRYPVLRSDGAAELVASLLGSLQPLGRDERVLARWVLAPGSPPRLPVARRTPKRGGGLMVLRASVRAAVGARAGGVAQVRRAGLGGRGADRGQSRSSQASCTPHEPGRVSDSDAA